MRIGVLAHFSCPSSLSDYSRNSLIFMNRPFSERLQKYKLINVLQFFKILTPTGC